MQKYQEDVLIKKGIMYFLAPSLLLGIMSVFFPLCYALVPAHESGLCLCTLLTSGIWANILPIRPAAYLSLNTLMFYGVNWIFLMSIIYMLNKIRHI
jgi:hypothetical protein